MDSTKSDNCFQDSDVNIIKSILQESLKHCKPKEVKLEECIVKIEFDAEDNALCYTETSTVTHETACNIKKEVEDIDDSKSHSRVQVETKLTSPHKLLWKNDTAFRNNVKVFICDLCGKEFNLKSTLRNHMDIHFTDKRLKCKICKKVFIDHYRLKRHMNVHNKEFICHICKNAFTDRYGLRRHINVHSMNFVCEICNKSFTDKYSLDRHATVHTMMECDICQETCTSKTYNRHMLNHSKNYICQFCDKPFDDVFSSDSILERVLRHECNSDSDT